MNKRLSELCDCAFEQGYGRYSHRASDFAYLPSLDMKTYIRLKEILEEEKQNE